MQLSRYARIGLFGAAALAMGSVCVFHLSHVGLKTPHIKVDNYGEGTGQNPDIPMKEIAPGVFGGIQMRGAISVSGTDIKAPLERFEKAFNAQIDEQDSDRSNDYLYAGIADAAGAFAALVSVIIEASAAEEDTNGNKNNKPNKPTDNGPSEGEPQNGQRRPNKKTNAATENDDPVH